MKAKLIFVPDLGGLLLLLFHVFGQFLAQKELCGELEVHKQQWIVQNGRLASSALQLDESQPSSDLRQCLERCCALTNCSAVTFGGFLGPQRSAENNANCSLFHCQGIGGECTFEDAPESAAEFGVLSVRLRRPKAEEEASLPMPTTTSSTATMPPIPSTTASPSQGKGSSETGNEEEREEDLNRTFPFGRRSGGDDGQILPLGKDEDLPEKDLAKMRTNATKERMSNGANNTRGPSLLNLDSWDEKFPLNPDHTPVWAIGLAIVVTVVSLGLLMAMLGSFLCYRRYRSRMRCTEISGGPKKMPTLHAFNPS